MRNDGDEASAATTLRYYQSTDATITTSDTEVGTDTVAALAASGSSTHSVELTAPTTPGTYYYGACVDAVAEESDTTNNCLGSVQVDVLESELQSQGHPDLVVLQSVSDSNPAAGEQFTFSATVQNIGDGDAVSTRLRYYRSADATITTSDTEVGTDAVAALVASGSSTHSVELTTPTTPGTYYYGACVDAVAEESDTANNCSSSVSIMVMEPPPEGRVLISPRSLGFGALGQTAFVSVQILDGNSAVDTEASFEVDSVFTPHHAYHGDRRRIGRIGSGGLGITAVDGGLEVTANETGLGTIYINSPNASKAILNVTASQDPVALKLSPGSVSLAIGETATLRAQMMDANGHDIELADYDWGGWVVFWRTSDPAVATVDGNLDLVPAEGEAGATVTVTATGAGTATVTGSHIIWNDTATVTVTDN